MLLGLAALAGVVIGAGYFLSIYRKAFFGPLTSPVLRQTIDLKPRELLIVLVFAALILFNRLYPMGIIDFTQVASEHWIGLLQSERAVTLE